MLQNKLSADNTKTHSGLFTHDGLPEINLIVASVPVNNAPEPINNEK